jgi:hypothetical protein
MRQSFRVVLIRLVELHPERRSRMAGIKAGDVEPEAAQSVHKPWRHGPGLQANAGIRSAMLPDGAPDVFRIRDALAAPKSATGTVDDTNRRHFLRHIQTDIVGHRIASDGGRHRATPPGTRHYRQISRPPRLPDVHTWFHIAMRIQHATQAASGLSADNPSRVQAKAMIVEEVERLRWRIWNGKARNAKRSIDRIRKVMHVYQGRAQPSCEKCAVTQVMARIA